MSPAAQHNLRCPSCGYDLSGAPADQCPECGKHFNRELLASGWYERAPPAWPSNWALVASIAAGLAWSQNSEPGADAVEWMWFALVWLLAALWLYLRWRSIVTDRPWLPLWFWLVAAVLQENPSAAPSRDVAAYASSAVAAIATVGVFWCSPRAGFRGALYAAAVVSWIIALAFGIGAVSGLGFGSMSGTYRYLCMEMPAGGTNDLVAAVIAALHAGLGWGAWRIGSAVYPGRQ